MTVVDDIKERLDIVEIVEQTVKLRRTGKNYIGFCPFHSNTRTPAFVVFPETQTWRCFGQCNEGGDLFGYMMKREGWDFNEALRQLAARAGVTLTQQNPETEASVQSQQKLSAVLEAAAGFYREQMLTSPAGKKTLDYLHKRGLSDETIKIWGLGYAPAGWTTLLDYLRQKNYETGMLIAAGLLTERDDGSLHDRFRERLMFPIRGPYGQLAGFGGRTLEPDGIPKYLNSPATDVFDKGRLLYGLDQARKSIRSLNQAVIVEGYMDVIGLHQAGFTNAVSPMGTALTEDQFRLLKRLTRNVVLALDPDAAGQNATLRGLETARKAMDQESEIHFDSRGLMRVEQRINADIRVTALPGLQDPDEIVLENPEAWKQIIAKAKPVVVHVMETLAIGKDLNDAKVKRDIAAQVMPLIDDVGDSVEREAYRQQLAGFLRVDERSLKSARSGPAHSRRKKIESDQADVIPADMLSKPAQKNQMLERYLLHDLFLEPEGLFRLNKTLCNLELDPITESDFQNADTLAGYHLIAESLRQVDYTPSDFVEARLTSALEFEENPSFVEERHMITREKRDQHQVRAVVRMRLNRLEDRLEEIKFLQSDAVESKTYTEEEVQFLYLELLQKRRRLDAAMLAPEAGGSTRVRVASSIKSKSRDKA
ncbi:MAG: DNA primase [Anaerolineaceae bacterium]|jgi:DNA primase|nr:DNA primase [Anaerolineaceae bacterium]MDI9530469.1 DNA primase [Chloroflexota bacterium]HOF28253.1 DNA primase [Anaerolineaceae bacterium]